MTKPMTPKERRNECGKSIIFGGDGGYCW